MFRCGIYHKRGQLDVLAVGLLWHHHISPFPVQLVISVSFLTVSLHWRNRWTNSVNWLILRSGGSVQSDSIFLWKLLELSFPLLFSLGLIIALLAGFPQVLLYKIQRETNCSARLIYKASNSAYITSLLFDLHWLPISSRIQYKIALTCFHIVSDTAPYLSELLHLYSPSRSLRSAWDTQIFLVPRVCRRVWGEILSVYRTCHLELSFFLC